MKSYPKLKTGLKNRVPLDEAKRLWAEVRVANGLMATTPPLLTPPKGNTKLNKTQQWGLSLLPHRLGGQGNVCVYSTRGCRAVCLNTSGRGRAYYVQEARGARTALLFQHPAAFATLLEAEIMKLPAKAALRLNVFSDLPWEDIWPDVFNLRDDIQFYDYTKWPVGVRQTPPNYHLTYSASELWDDAKIVDTVNGGVNVTVVLRLKKADPMPKKWRGLKVVDGDKSDARYKDPVGVAVCLRAKGDARKSTSKFIREPVGATS